MMSAAFDYIQAVQPLGGASFGIRYDLGHSRHWLAYAAKLMVTNRGGQVERRRVVRKDTTAIIGKPTEFKWPHCVAQCR